MKIVHIAAIFGVLLSSGTASGQSSTPYGESGRLFFSSAFADEHIVSEYNYNAEINDIGMRLTPLGCSGPDHGRECRYTSTGGTEIITVSFLEGSYHFISDVIFVYSKNDDVAQFVESVILMGGLMNDSQMQNGIQDIATAIRESLQQDIVKQFQTSNARWLVTPLPDGNELTGKQGVAMVGQGTEIFPY